MDRQAKGNGRKLSITRRMTQMTQIPLNTDLANVANSIICDWIANPIVRSDYTQHMQKGAQQSIV